MVDGINGNYQNTSLSCVNDECKEIQEEERYEKQKIEILLQCWYEK